MPDSVVIPVLAYADVGAAITWLCDTFGFTVRLRIGQHRAQLVYGQGAMVVTQGLPPKGVVADLPTEALTHSIMLRVPDLDAHHARAVSRGARIIQLPQTFPYGEKQYTAEDLGGHLWTFSQTVADVDPASWFGVLTTLQ
jgi:uncharacterized glyoxalase superfamily protein PhnB